MAGPQTVWGIDVGKSALKAIKLRLGPDKSVEVVAVDYIEHAKLMSQQDADIDVMWRAAMEKFLSQNDISNDRVVVSVPGKPTLARFAKLPPVDKKKIPDIVRYEADQQIPFDMDEVVWDYQVFQAPDSPEVEVAILAVKRDSIRDHLLHFQAHGIEPFAVQSSPIALYNAVHYDEMLGDDAVVLIDIGTESTDLVVAAKDSLWTRTFDLGGNSFTESLVKSFKLSFSKAESLKRTAASSKYARQIFQAMRPVFADLVQELQRSLGFYTATHRDVDLSKVVGVGSAFQLPGLQKYIKQNLQMEMEVIEKFSKVSISSKTDSESDAPGSYAIAYGLALQGLGITRVDSNLLPPEIVKQVIWRKKRPFFAAIAACLLLSAGVVWFRQMSDMGTMNDARGDTQGIVSIPYERASDTIANPPQAPPLRYGETIQAAANAIKRKYSDLSSQGTNELKKIEQITGLLENRVLWLRILTAINEALPRPEKLSEVTSVEEYRDALAQVAKPRSQREEIFIDSLEAEYVPEVDAPDTIRDDWSAMADLIDNKGGKKRPGFIITLNCHTPNAGQGVFASSTFAKSLRKTARKPSYGFFVNRVGITSAADRSSSSSRRSTDRRGRSGRDKGTSERKTEVNIDPITGEDASEDWYFQVRFDVILEDLPEKSEKKDN